MIFFPLPTATGLQWEEILLLVADSFNFEFLQSRQNAFQVEEAGAVASYDDRNHPLLDPHINQPNAFESERLGKLPLVQKIGSSRNDTR